MGFFGEFFSDETGVPQSDCSFSEGTEVVTMIESDVCLVAPALASKSYGINVKGVEPWSPAQLGKN